LADIAVREPGAGFSIAPAITPKLNGGRPMVALGVTRETLREVVRNPDPGAMSRNFARRHQPGRSAVDVVTTCEMRRSYFAGLLDLPPGEQ